MELAIAKSRLLELIVTQVRNHFLIETEEEEAIGKHLDMALERTETCFAPNPNKYYRREGAVWFNPYQSAQYCIFLYYLANTIRCQGSVGFVCDKLYFLNKALNGIDLFYEVEMPDVFFLDHPVGSVMGRAKYGRYFTFNQNCTVGNNKGVYPRIGENVRMYSGSRILGNCEIGDNVVLASGTFVKDQDIPSCSLVFGTSPHLIIKPRDMLFFQRRQ